MSGTSFRRRIERLEASGPSPKANSTVYLDVYSKELENIGRLEAVPFTEEEQAYRREADRWFRQEYLPGQRENANVSGHTRALLEGLEEHARPSERRPA